MTRLEIENRKLKDKLDHHFSVYARMLHENVALQTKLQMIDLALRGDDSECP